MRHRSASWRFSRKMGRGIARAVPDDQLGSCFVIAFILVVAGPIALPLMFLIAMALMPILAFIAFLKIVAYVIEHHYPEMFMSWFFLKEDEPDGTILPIGEIKSRFQAFLESS